MIHGADPATSLTRVNRRLVELVLDPEVPESVALQAIVDCALEAGPAADLCGLQLRRRRGRLESVAVTSERAAALHALEAELAEGPAVTVSGSEADAPLVVPDLGTDDRWPRWSAAARDAGVGSVVSVRLTSAGSTLGALTWYSARPDRFDGPAVVAAAAFADLASAAAATAQTVVGLRRAVRSRHLIGMAQGVLMQRYAMTEDAAFEVLRRYSSHDNVKLRDVAERVIAAGDLPEGPPGEPVPAGS